jgi:hypothetical protein
MRTNAMRRLWILLLAAAWVMVTAARADAYIGPGAGVSVLGTVAAFIGAVIFAIVGFVWYPLKRLMNALRRARRPADEHEPSVP